MAERQLELSDLGLGFLTVNTVVALFRSRSDPWTASFVLLAYVSLLLLFWCLRTHEKTDPRRDLHKREKLKLAVLVLAAILNISFSYQVSGLLPPALKVFVWCLAVSVTGGSLYLFYLVPAP